MNVPEIERLFTSAIEKAQRGILKAEDLASVAEKSVDMFNEKYREYMLENFFNVLKVGCKPIITINQLNGGEDLSSWKIGVKITGVEFEMISDSEVKKLEQEIQDESKFNEKFDQILENFSKICKKINLKQPK